MLPALLLQPTANNMCPLVQAKDNQFLYQTSASMAKDTTELEAWALRLPTVLHLWLVTEGTWQVRVH
jgi:hypothetical protein